MIKLLGGAAAPEGWGVVLVPGVPGRLEFPDLVRVFFGQVGGLADVVLEVVEAGLGDAFAAFGGQIVADEFPVALADGHLFAQAPMQCLVRCGFFLPLEVGQQVHALDLPIGLGSDGGGSQRGGQDVELDDGLVVDGACRDDAGPGGEEGDADAALERGAFGAAQGFVDRAVEGGARHGGAAVVAEEEDEGVLVEAGIAELGGDGADGIVHGAHHGGVAAAPGIGDGGEFFQAWLIGLQGGVDGVEGEVEEERVGLVAFDEADRFAGEGVGEVGGVLLAGRLGAAEDAVGPEVIVRAAEETEELIEAALPGMVVGRGAKVPLADQGGAVPGGLEAVGQGFLGEGQALLGAVAWIELVAEAGLVFAGEQSGAGGGAVGAADIAAGAAGAGFGQSIEMRGGDVGAAMEADIGVAHVVADDDDDVRTAGFLG